ncbi:MAG TPA: hypothetical protein VGN07_16190 [Steroidobacteraceae bacterium]|jgi:hypothetical protein
MQYFLGSTLRALQQSAFDSKAAFATGTSSKTHATGAVFEDSRSNR